MLFPAYAFLISVAFWPGIAGPATSPRWALVALSLYWLPLASLPYLAWCFWKLDFDQACHWAFVAAALGLGAKISRRQFHGIVLAFCLGIAVSSLVAAFQVFGWQGIPQAVPPGGLFVNKNIMGEAAVLGLLAARELFPLRSKEWTACLISMLPAIGLSQSRGVWLALLCGLVFRMRWSLAFCSALLLLALFLLGTNGLSSDTLLQRMSLWHDALRNLTWWGSGSYDYSTPTMREPNLHNDWLQFVYELGLVGIIPIALVASIRDRAPSFVAGLFVLASFAFPLHDPATAWLAAAVVGYWVRYNADVRRVTIYSGTHWQKLRSSCQSA